MKKIFVFSLMSLVTIGLFQNCGKSFKSQRAILHKNEASSFQTRDPASLDSQNEWSLPDTDGLPQIEVIFSDLINSKRSMPPNPKLEIHEGLQIMKLTDAVENLETYSLIAPLRVSSMDGISDYSLLFLNEARNKILALSVDNIKIRLNWISEFPQTLLEREFSSLQILQEGSDKILKSDNFKISKIQTSSPIVTKKEKVCLANEHLENNVCVSNTKACSIANGIGLQYYGDGSWSSCLLQTCNTGYYQNKDVCTASLTPLCKLNQHKEGLHCINNTMKCEVDNGSGSRSWNETSGWGPCEYNCHSGYQLYLSKCVRSKITCNPDQHLQLKLLAPEFEDFLSECVSNERACNVSNGAGTKSWDKSKSAWNACTLETCNYPGYQKNGNQCIRVPNDVANFKQISTGNDFTCAVTSQNTVQCWGANRAGQLGNNSSVDSAIPVNVLSLRSIKQVAAGSASACALNTSGAVWCWGSNLLGQLGNSTTNTSYVPVKVLGLADVQEISAAAGAYTCARLGSGKVKCWGSNVSGLMGDSSRINALVPVEISGLTGVKQISAGFSHACAIVADNRVKCWGMNSFGQLGNNSQTDSPTPVFVSNLGNVKQISVSAHRALSCALIESGDVYCWGSNRRNSFMGDATIAYALVPVAPNITGLIGVKHIETSGSYICFINQQDEVQCWGENANGQLGNGSVLSSLSQVITTNLSDVKQISLSDHGCAITLTGTKCWGLGDRGQIGNGLTESSSTPLYVVKPIFEICKTGEHLERVGSPNDKVCLQNLRSCYIRNGLGTQNWNGAGYSTCKAVSCEPHYHIENGACKYEVQSCPSQPSQIQRWNGVSYGSCGVSPCDSKSHLESNVCVPNASSCSVTNGSGTMQWTGYGSGYGICKVTSCDSGFIEYRESCVQPFLPLSVQIYGQGDFVAGLSHRLSFLAREGSPAIVRYECRLDGGPFVACISPLTYELAEGRHTVSIRGFDAAGNPSAVAAYSWYNDDTGPALRFTVTPQAITTQTTANFSFVATDRGSGTSGEIGCNLDNHISGDCDSGKFTYRNLSKGVHTLKVFATDNVDNETVISYTWRIQ